MRNPGDFLTDVFDRFAEQQRRVQKAGGRAVLDPEIADFVRDRVKELVREERGDLQRVAARLDDDTRRVQELAKRLRGTEEHAARLSKLPMGRLPKDELAAAAMIRNDSELAKGAGDVDLSAASYGRRSLADDSGSVNVDAGRDLRGAVDQLTDFENRSAKLAFGDSGPDLLAEMKAALRRGVGDATTIDSAREITRIVEAAETRVPKK